MGGSRLCLPTAGDGRMSALLCKNYREILKRQVSQLKEKSKWSYLETAESKPFGDHLLMRFRKAALFEMILTDSAKVKGFLYEEESIDVNGVQLKA